MENEIFKDALSAAQQKLADLEQRQADLERQEAEISNELIEIASQKVQLMETINSLSKLCGVPNLLLAGQRITFGALTNLGLSDAIREILKNKPSEKFYPLEVREHLIAGGFPVSQHSNLMASIHTALKRMSSGLAEIMETKKEGKTAYQWSVALVRARATASVKAEIPLEPLTATPRRAVAPRVMSEKDKK
jgi:hypothetical protein